MTLDPSEVTSPAVGPKPLTEKQRIFVNYVEQHWHSHGDVNSKVPTAAAIRHGTGLSAEEVAAFTKDFYVVKALEARGITLSNYSQLLPEQLAVANALLDFTDRRSQAAKLKELGVTSSRYQGWLRQERFQRYIRMRAEALLGDVQHEAHAALLRNVSKGELNSIKLYYEMTGRWSSKTASDLNVEFILIKVVEAVQRYVKDPEAIKAIAGELQSLIGSGNAEVVKTAPVSQPPLEQPVSQPVVLESTAVSGEPQLPFLD